MLSTTQALFFSEEFRKKSTKYKDILYKRDTHSRFTPDNIQFAANLCLNYIPRKILLYLKKIDVVINFINLSDSIIKPVEKVKCFGYCDFEQHTINIIKPEKLKTSEAIQEIIFNLSHEIGHFVFILLILNKVVNPKIDTLLTSFESNTLSLGGITEYADKYIQQYLTKKYSKIEQGYELCIHENFCEMFAIYIEELIEEKDKLLKNELYTSFINLINSLGEIDENICNPSKP